MTTHDEANTDLGLASSVRGIWQQTLHTPINDDTDFFDSGGSSLAAVAISARIEEVFGVRPALRVLFDHPQFGDYVVAVGRIVLGTVR